MEKEAEERRINKRKQMKSEQTQHDKMAKLLFKDVYPHYITKVEKKGRTISELNQIIEWLTG